MKRQLLYWIMLLSSGALLAQSVIINEMSQGSGGGKEWVELLVITDGVDMRGWELGDNDDDTWHSIAEFASHPKWSSVARGTIIVVFNDGDVDGQIAAASGEDTVITDKSVIIGIGNTSFLTDTGPWGATTGAFANSDGDDAAAVRDADDVMIHDMAVSHPTAIVTAPGSAQVKYYTGNTAEGVANSSNWTAAASTSGTPGEGNGGENSIWIDTSLPVELGSWTARSVKEGILLGWVTESETENQGFILLRSEEDGHHPREIASFSTHAELRGAGSTHTRTSYAFLDGDVFQERTYSYQLLDIDYANQVTTHPELSILFKPPVAGSESFRLDSIYPNPGNPGLAISLEVIDDSELQVEIYDLRGRFIRSIASDHLGMGKQVLHWDGRDRSDTPVPSGTYLLRIESSSQVLHKRVTVIR